MENQEKKIKLAMRALVILVIVAGFLIFLIIKNHKKLSDTLDSIVTSKEDVSAVVFPDDLIVQDDNGATKKIDVASGKIEEASALEKEDFTGFVGLPKFGDDGNESTQQVITLVSQDRSKAIVTVAVYDQKAPVNDFTDTQPILRTSEYVCVVADKKCEPSNLLSQAYFGLDPNLQKEYGALWWAAWDSKKNILFGHLSGEGIGNASPVYACNTVEKKCVKTEGFDSLKDGEVRAGAPDGMFSPSLSKFVMVNQHDNPNVETGKNWELLMYSTDNLSKPLKTYNISVIIDRDESVAYDSVQSVAWSGDEKKIAIGTSRRIFMFDIESGSLSLAYIAPTDQEGDFYWDSSKLFLSSDAKYIAFVDETGLVDTLDGATDQEDAVYINVLKKIDLENSNKVSELLQGPGLSLK